jgi:DNA-binding CsgD family transcriptional regulator
MPTGAVRFGEELVPRRTLERSPFHNELSLPYGLDDLMAGVLVNTDDELVTVGIVGGRNVRFGERHKHTVKRLLPHLTNAVAIGKRLLCNPYDDDRPLLEERLRCSYELTAAEARVAALVGRSLTPKEVAIVLGTSWNTVRAQLCRVFAKTGARRQTELARLVHRLEPGTRPSGRTDARPAGGGVSVEDALRRRYGLTRTETRVAVQVSRGMSAKETAASLGSRWNTVRYHLRQIYAKTRTTGQADLTRLVMQLESHPH